MRTARAHECTGHARTKPDRPDGLSFKLFKKERTGLTNTTHKVAKLRIASHSSVLPFWCAVKNRSDSVRLPCTRETGYGVVVVGHIPRSTVYTIERSERVVLRSGPAPSRTCPLSSRPLFPFFGNVRKIAHAYLVHMCRAQEFRSLSKNTHRSALENTCMMHAQSEL